MYIVYILLCNRYYIPVPVLVYIIIILYFTSSSCVTFFGMKDHGFAMKFKEMEINFI